MNFLRSHGRSSCVCLLLLGIYILAWNHAKITNVLLKHQRKPKHSSSISSVIQRVATEGSVTLQRNRTIDDPVNHVSSLDSNIRVRLVPPRESDRTFPIGQVQLGSYGNRNSSPSRPEDLSPKNVSSVQGAKSAGMEDRYIRSLERIRRTQISFSLSTVFPHGGNTLPNYLTRGLDQGISPASYHDGIISFLHLNKAAGTTVKRCLTEFVTQRILKNRSVQVLSSNRFTRMSYDDIMKHNVFEGDHIFGLCEHSGRANCSYFTFLRDPYERVLSAYFYCRAKRDQLCGPIKTKAFTIRQWAIYQGSYFFYQLLMDKKYCEPNEVITDLLGYGLNDSLSFIPPGTRKSFTPKTANMCWFKQRAYLNVFLNETGREAILRNVFDNLETWFSVIGLTEEYDLSLEMLSVTYDLPFYKNCRGGVSNRSPTKVGGEVAERQRLKLELTSSPEVAEALKYDVKIYEKGKEIFQRQKERLEIFTKQNG